MSRGVVRPEVIHGLHKAAADERLPNSIDECAGKIPISRVRHLLGKLLAQLAALIAAGGGVDLANIRLGFGSDAGFRQLSAGSLGDLVGCVIKQVIHRRYLRQAPFVEQRRPRNYLKQRMMNTLGGLRDIMRSWGYDR